MQVDPSLTEAIATSLKSLLINDATTVQAAEKELSSLEVTDNYCVSLVFISTSVNYEPGLRQLASVMLKQYVKHHWSKQDTVNFRPPETTPEVKQIVRQYLPQGLSSDFSKVRNSVAYAIATIAHWDWPEEWSDLFIVLITALQSGSMEAVKGSMRTLSEISMEISDMDLPQLCPVMFPSLIKVFTAKQNYSIRCRSRAVHIMGSLVNVAVSTVAVNSKLSESHVLSHISTILDSFIEEIKEANPQLTDPGLKKEIIKILEELVVEFPVFMSPYLNNLLSAIWTSLLSAIQTYTRSVINQDDDIDDPVDSEGETISYESFVYSLLNFIQRASTSSKKLVKKMIKTSLNDLVYHVIILAQLPNEKVQNWSENVNEFIEDTEDETYSYSVRLCIQDLFESFSEEFPKHWISALITSVNKHLLEIQELRKQGTDPNWWKRLEVIISLVGMYRKNISRSKQIPFDLPGFLNSVVLESIQQNELFLQTSSLWCAGRLSMYVAHDQNAINSLLAFIVRFLSNDCHPSLRVTAIRAASMICDQLKAIDNTQILVPHLHSLVTGTLQVIQDYREPVLPVCLTTLSFALAVDENVTASLEPNISPALLIIFQEFFNSPSALILCNDIFKELASNSHCSLQVEERILPVLLNILRKADSIDCNAVEATLDVIGTLIRSQQRLSDRMMNEAFQLVLQISVMSEDHIAISSACEVLRFFLCFGSERVEEWRDEQGNNGISYILQVISRLLDPQKPAEWANSAGRLIGALLRLPNLNLAENADRILLGVLSKLNSLPNSDCQSGDRGSTVSCLGAKLSLLLVLAQLCDSHLDQLINFLSSVPDVNGKPALGSVLTLWCANQHMFFGDHQVKISIIGLMRLLEHAVKNNDARFQAILVDGDPEEDSASVCSRTRSKKEEIQFTQIPLVVKIYKLLINELSKQVEDEDEDSDAEYDTEDEEEDGIDDLISGVEMGNEEATQNLIDHIKKTQIENDPDLVDDDDDDPVFNNDPRMAINLKEQLTLMFQNLSQQPYFSSFSHYHNEMEKQVLRQVLNVEM